MGIDSAAVQTRRVCAAPRSGGRGGAGAGPAGAGQENHNDVFVSSIAGNASGATAWISNDVDFGTPVREVHVRRADGGRKRLDRSTEIGEGSLGKSYDEQTIY